MHWNCVRLIPIYLIRTNGLFYLRLTCRLFTSFRPIVASRPICFWLFCTLNLRLPSTIRPSFLPFLVLDFRIQNLVQFQICFFCWLLFNNFWVYLILLLRFHLLVLDYLFKKISFHFLYFLFLILLDFIVLAHLPISQYLARGNVYNAWNTLLSLFLWIFGIFHDNFLSNGIYIKQLTLDNFLFNYIELTIFFFYFYLICGLLSRWAKF
jgi:hypothetical protein